MIPTGLALAVAAALADPAACAPPPAKLRAAQALAARLADPSFDAREAASAGLAKLGRAALPALTEALTSPSAEVRGRAAVIRPAAAEADRALRIASFLADGAGRYRHDVPGWAALAAAAGDTPESRRLFAAVAAEPANVRLLKSLDRGADARELNAALVARREELYRAHVNSASGRQGDPAAAAVAAVMAAEVVTGTEAPPAPSLEYPTARFLVSTAGRAALVGDGPLGRPLAKLARSWMRTRRTAAGLVSAVSAANAASGTEGPRADPFPQELLVELAARMFARADVAVTTRISTAWPILMRTRAAGQLPTLAGPLADETEIFSRNDSDGPTIKVRDLALCAALVATGQNPVSYGFSDRSSLGRLTYQTYTFRDDPAGQKGGRKAESKRDAAFAQWAAWRAATRGALGGAALAGSPDLLVPGGRGGKKERSPQMSARNRPASDTPFGSTLVRTSRTKSAHCAIGPIASNTA